MYVETLFERGLTMLNSISRSEFSTSCFSVSVIWESAFTNAWVSRVESFSVSFKMRYTPIVYTICSFFVNCLSAYLKTLIFGSIFALSFSRVSLLFWEFTSLFIALMYLCPTEFQKFFMISLLALSRFELKTLVEVVSVAPLAAIAIWNCAITKNINTRLEIIFFIEGG